MAIRSLLDVYVNDRLVGTLGPADGGAYVFTYLSDVPSESFVSLTMRVQLESYVWRRGLPPFFLMNLPEGYQKDLVRAKLGPHADVSDVGLLALTGSRTIGRVRVLPKGQPLTSVGNDLALASILAAPDSRESLLRYLKTGITEGVSGVMPKTLATKATITTAESILKTGLADLPGLAINEFLCLEVARKAGLRVPSAQVSQDGAVLAVHRFDRADGGEWLGVEDFCALKGLDPINKYKGSLEDITKLLASYVPARHFGESAVRLFKLFLLNYALRNADAHLKNYALTYTTGSDVTLAPVYDIVTVTAYPEFKTDPPALTLSGRKVWHAGKSLHQLGALRLGLTGSQMALCVEEVSTSVTETAPQVRRYADAYPQFRETAKRMLAEWESGMLDIAPAVRAAARPNEQLPRSVRFSYAAPRPKKPRKTAQAPPSVLSHKTR
jgi:serine/threonine-protein kinase HipA